MKAFAQLFSSYHRAFSNKFSVAFRSRRFGTEIIEQSEGITQNLINYPLKSVDEGISRLAFNVGMINGRRLGLRSYIFDYADSIANKANVIYTKSNAPAVLRSRLGKIIFPLQTFVTNAGNFMVQDVGAKLLTPGKRMEGAGKALRFAGTSIALGSIYKAFEEATDSRIGLPDDFLGFIPFMSAFRFGAPGIGGEVVRAMTRFSKADEGEGLESLMDSAIRLGFRMGPPRGGLQAERILRQGRNP